MTRYFKRASIIGASILLAGTVLGPRVALADPDEKPTIDEVKERIDSLNHEAEVASEKLNTVREELALARKHLRTLDADLQRQRHTVSGLREQVIGDAVTDVQNGTALTTTTSFLVADDPAQFIDDLATDEIVQDEQAGMLTTLLQEQKKLALQEKQVEREVDAIGDDKQDLLDYKQTLGEKTEKAEDILAELEEEQRQRLLEMQAEEPAHTAPPSRDTPRVPVNDVPASERAQVAVQTALAQVGKPYVYGAAGPDAFDCSGLTMYAWAAAGVSIPHASSMQPGAGTPVSISDLMPGDLVFYYSPISHVGMYIGNGQIVHAANPSRPVEVVSLNLMPINSAVRIG